ncbi:DUF1990 family protein [Microbacterium karelineae]|uniref:DUF1990 family protein n=1 Tax=Microbacterium karelineae TaxID=2654283 RepID=UPI0018D274C4|nr:DUF1990 family protein [Microbacterium karelineae]
MTDFTYPNVGGTRGEEAFVVERDGDGSVWLRVTAFSRPAGALFWIGDPLVRIMQEICTRRCLRALR